LQQQREISLKPRVITSEQTDSPALLEVKALPTHRHGLWLRQEPSVGGGEQLRDVRRVGFEDWSAWREAAWRNFAGGCRITA
jgi:hypothetical protein